MPVKFSFGDGYCIKQRGGNYGLWEIVTKDPAGKENRVSTEYAIYVSAKLYNELVRRLKEDMRDLKSSLTKHLIEDFIEDALDAKEPLALGGVVAYFFA